MALHILTDDDWTLEEHSGHENQQLGS